MVATRDSLGIFWQGDEVDGFTFYGYWVQPGVRQPQIKFDAWPNVQTKASNLVGDRWTVWLWDVRMHAWPQESAWRSLVMDLLDQVLRGGAVVAWCGIEGAFADPPSLFTAQAMSDGVWAARTIHGDTFNPPDLRESFKTLTIADLNKLRFAAGL
jgi:hypothetical protein